MLQVQVQQLQEKRNPAQLFLLSSEFCDNLKNTYFVKNQGIPASVLFAMALNIFIGISSKLDLMPWSNFLHLKGAPSGLGEFLATERPLKVMKNAFYFTLKALFVLKIFKFFS